MYAQVVIICLCVSNHLQMGSSKSAFLSGIVWAKWTRKKRFLIKLLHTILWLDFIFHFFEVDFRNYEDRKVLNSFRPSLHHYKKQLYSFYPYEGVFLRAKNLNTFAYFHLYLDSSESIWGVSTYQTWLVWFHTKVSYRAMLILFFNFQENISFNKYSVRVWGS